MQTVKLVLLTTLIVGYGVALQAGVMPDELGQITLPSIAEPSNAVVESVEPVAVKGLWQGLMEFVMLATLIIL
jgi:threonine/homoserine efflux transporter RhtA